jgi:hypothetical protein
MSEELIRCPACNAAWQIDRAAPNEPARCPMCQAWITPPSADGESEPAENEPAETQPEAIPPEAIPPEAGPEAATPISSRASAWSARPGQMALWFGLASLASLACCCGLPFLSTPLAVGGLLIGFYGIKQANQGQASELNSSIAGVGLSGLSLVLGLGMLAMAMISSAVEKRNAAEQQQAAPAAPAPGADGERSNESRPVGDESPPTSRPTE